MRTKQISLGIVLADLLSVPLALFFAYLLRYGRHIRTVVLLPTPWAVPILLMFAMGGWLLLYEPMSLDCFREGWRFSATVSRIMLAVAIQISAILALAYLLRIYYSRLVLMYFVALFCALTLTTRLIVFVALDLRRKAGRTRRVVILGEGRVASELARRMQRHPELLYEVIGFLNPSTNSGNGKETNSGNGQGGLSSIDVLQLLKQQNVHDLMICLEHAPSIELQNFIVRCREQGVGVSLLPHAYELYSSKARLLEIEGVPLIFLEEPHHPRTTAICKKIVDLTLGSLLALTAIPIVLVAGTALWLRGRRFLRREMRCGLHGRPFRMYRLDIDRHAPNAPAFHQFLCRASISELPQLLNVLSGDMSLVGPRPESFDRVRDYSEWQRQRLNVKPGMTGLAQINGLREQHPSEEKTRYDLQYMVEWSPIIDPVILLQTIWTLGGRLWPHNGHDMQASAREEESRSKLAQSSFE